MTVHSFKPFGPSGRSDVVARLLLFLLVSLCSLLPLLWMSSQLLARPHVWRAMNWSGFHFDLLGRTLLYNAAAAVLATVLSLPAALVVGRGRGGLAKLLVFLLPLAFLMPSVTYTYGWVQVLRLLDVNPLPAGPGDVLRCVWTLACWLWALPALGIGLSLRFLDSQIQQQALLDGALWRVTARQLAAPVLGSLAVVMVLAVQEFGVYERTGVSVIATEIRTVFETGSLGASTASIAGVSGGAGRDAPDQAERAAAAVATAVPLLLLLAALTLLALWGLGRLSAGGALEVNAWPRVLDAPAGALFATAALLLLTLGLPTAAMIHSMSRPFDPAAVWTALGPHLTGSLLAGSLAGAFALLLAALACVRRVRLLLVVALLSFIIGGELLAISNIRIYNQPAPWPFEGLRVSGHDAGASTAASALDAVLQTASAASGSLRGWVYNHVPVMVIAYLGRFGWVALLAGSMTWSASFRDLRDMAGLDGATPFQVARAVIWPIAWPVLLASAVLVMILSMTEVGATVLLAPQRPQMLVPLLMGWVHMLRYDDMLEGSLLLMAVVFLLGTGSVMLFRLGIKLAGVLRKPAGALPALALLALLPLAGCDDAPGGVREPDAVAGATGTGKLQFVYPRALCYSKSDDTFYAIDRLARVQRLDGDLNYLNEWRMPEWEAGKPVGVSAGPDGNVYVADTHYYRIVVFSPKGEKLREWGSRGSGPGQFTFTTDIAFDRHGHVYVSEYGDNDRIQVFTPDGTFLRQFGRHGQADGEFNRPESLVIDGDTLYVTDSCNHRISVFKTDGTFLRNIGRVGSELGEFRWPYGMDLDSDGRLVVAEFGNNRVQRIDKETGRGLETWGLAGREPGQLAYPWAVAVGRKDKIVVLDSGNNRLQAFTW